MHKLYGLKQEVLVLPVGIAIHFSIPYKGSSSDKTILANNYNKHLALTKKKLHEEMIEDTGPLQDKYPSNWCILVDKGYQGCAKGVCIVTPKKTPPCGSLTTEEKEQNKNLSSDRIIVENFFGREYKLWGLMAKKF